MKSFFKAQLSSLLATAIDFLLMIACVEIGKIHYTIAVVIGAVGGALTNFIVNRYWSFNVTDTSVKQQGLKYSLVWLGSLFLNVSGVYLLTQFLGLKYIVSKIIVSVSVGISFNYLLQKQYVFSSK